MYMPECALYRIVRQCSLKYAKHLPLSWSLKANPLVEEFMKEFIFNPCMFAILNSCLFDILRSNMFIVLSSRLFVSLCSCSVLVRLFEFLSVPHLEFELVRHFQFLLKKINCSAVITDRAAYSKELKKTLFFLSIRNKN